MPTSLAPLVLIFLGSGLGGMLRWLMSQGVGNNVSTGFPWPTLSVNLLGCLAIGFLVEVLATHGGGAWRSQLLVTGLLGGFTTFSTFSLEAYTLLERQQYAAATGYMVLSLAGGLLALALGLFIARQVA